MGSLRSKIRSNMKDIAHQHEDRQGSGNSIPNASNLPNSSRYKVQSRVQMMQGVLNANNSIGLPEHTQTVT